MKKAAISILLTVALLTACGKSGGSMDHSSHGGTSGSANNAAQRDTAAMDHSSMANEAGSNQAGNVHAQFKLSSNKIMPNQDTTITINIKDKTGKPIDKLDTVHEKQMHRL